MTRICRGEYLVELGSRVRVRVSLFVLFQVNAYDTSLSR